MNREALVIEVTAPRWLTFLKHKAYPRPNDILRVTFLHDYCQEDDRNEYPAEPNLMSTVPSLYRSESSNPINIAAVRGDFADTDPTGHVQLFLANSCHSTFIKNNTTVEIASGSPFRLSGFGGVTIFVWGGKVKAYSYRCPTCEELFTTIPIDEHEHPCCSKCGSLFILNWDHELAIPEVIPTA